MILLLKAKSTTIPFNLKMKLIVFATLLLPTQVLAQLLSTQYFYQYGSLCQPEYTFSCSSFLAEDNLIGTFGQTAFDYCVVEQRSNIAWRTADSQFSTAIAVVRENSMIPNKVSLKRRLLKIDEQISILNSAIGQLRILWAEKKVAVNMVQSRLNEARTRTLSEGPAFDYNLSSIIYYTNSTLMTLKQESTCNYMLNLITELRGRMRLWAGEHETFQYRADQYAAEFDCLLSTIQTDTKNALARKSPTMMRRAYSLYLKEVTKTIAPGNASSLAFAEVSKTLFKLQFLTDKKKQLVGNVTSMRYDPKFQ